MHSGDGLCTPLRTPECRVRIWSAFGVQVIVNILLKYLKYIKTTCIL